MRAPSPDELRDQVDRDDPDQSSAAITARRPGRRRVRARRVRTRPRRPAGRGRIAGAFRSGAGLGWHEHDESVFTGCEQFFRPGCIANLVPAWIPALDGVDGKLRAGAVVADIGCGLGASTILLAQHFPNSRIAGSDYHDRSIELARKRATDAGIADRVTFEVAGAGSFSGSGYDLATTFDCLHDMGTRSGRPGIFARPSSRTAAGWSWSRTPPTSPRAT
jgi:2-polyprenyl-3-methyl-5-hydroxy-6-metoxy-1,4-benzoquinol methylase